MYKIISILAFLLFLSQIDSFAVNTKAEFNLEDEEYVNDIPFNTNDIISIDLDSSKNEDLSSDFEFGLKMIVVRKIMAVEFYMEEEENVNDIPFETESLSDNCPEYLDVTLEKCMSIEFQLEDEEYIDDIPFNTCDVLKNLRP